MIATVAAPLADGAYTVNWHAVLTDGDASDGSFTFTVQTAGQRGDGGGNCFADCSAHGH